MPSRFLDPTEVKRQEERRFDFNHKSLAGRVVLVPGGIGGLGSAITALVDGQQQARQREAVPPARAEGRPGER